MKKLRYQILLEKPGSILHVGGMVESVIALPGKTAEVVLFIDSADKEKFEKLIEGQSCVKKYFAHPTNDKRAKTEVKS